eukprot:gnl/MRDRNA2_/MRDRNA2_140861_c0_seq1.p1 gnl/MRDRNA2_/MRDRNA2_140861_c0~~gnl/MRDRNA2_/MRDRNA2_140861_c0_seq1.p1  ORF type:complete len:308 (+),score=64.42 gnl/MRDRNA2_/MRDRNA2_140861_c0_seq1:64-924(+)
MSITFKHARLNFRILIWVCIVSLRKVLCINICHQSALHPRANVLCKHFAPVPSFCIGNRHCKLRQRFVKTVWAYRDEPNTNGGEASAGWAANVNTWADAAREVRILLAMNDASAMRTWAKSIAGKARAGAQAARAVQEIATDPEDDDVATAFKAAAAAWELAAEGMDVAAEEGQWTATGARRIAGALRATGVGSGVAASPDIAKAWETQAGIWQAVAEYIEQEGKWGDSEDLVAWTSSNIVDIPAMPLVGLFAFIAVISSMWCFRLGLICRDSYHEHARMELPMVG